MFERWYLRSKDNALQRFIAVPVTTGLALWWLYMGVFCLIEGFTAHRVVSSFVAGFPRLATVFIGLGFLFGALTTLWGVYTHYPRVDVIWLLHKIGYTSVIVSGGLYTYLAARHMPIETLVISLGVFHTVIGLFGLISVASHEWLTRHQMRDQGYDA